MAEPESPWEKIEAMPEFQAKTPTEKLAYADAYVQRMSDQLAPKLAGRPDAQEAFRGRVKDFIFTVADKHFPSGLEAAPSQIGESLAREDRALSIEGARLNTEIGKQAETTLAGLEGKPDDEMLKGDPTTFQTLSPNQDTTVGEYKTYLKSVIDAQAVKGGKKAGDIVESFDESAKRTPSAAMLKLQLSEGWAGWDELIAKSEDPIDTAIAAISGTMLESGVQSAKGAVAGAAATAATGNPLVGGAVMGGVAGESEYQATYLGELQSELQKRGKADAATIQEILKDDEFNARVDKKAMTRGVTVGAAEGVSGYLSFGLANKIGGSSVKKALLGVGVEAGVGAVGGSGGEFLARLFSGEDVWTPEARKDIVSEGVAELGQAGTGTATVAFRQFLNQRSPQQATSEQSQPEASNQPAEISRFEEFSNPNEFYRVVVGDEAFQDIVDTGTVRAKPASEQAPTPGQISLRARPTAFPSFSQGEVLSGYAESNPNHFIIATSDPSIKPSESGRHGKGKTMFPTDQDGNPTSSLDASKVRVYRHLGDGKYQLVYQNGQRINEASATTPIPEVDDAPVRSVIEEFSDEADATEVSATDVPEVAPIPESPVPVIEPESTAAETPPATEVSTPAPVEAPAVVDEAAPETVDLGQPEVINAFDIDEGLRIEVIRNLDGTATVEKINTETGVTIPLEGAAAPFENPKAALDFLSSTFTRNRDGDIVTEAASNEPGILERGEQDPLMIFLQTEKMQPKQTDIRTIGRISQKERKGFRGLEEDTSRQASYENAPLLRDYQSNPAAQERLRGIYSRESGNRPDQIADRAYQQGWISAPTAEALYQGIRERLDGDGGLVSQRRESDKEIADMVAERSSQVENDAEAFFSSIKSPYRRGGVVPARQLQMGDRLQVGDDTIEVTEANEDGVTVRSSKRGIFPLSPDESVGYDSILEENGLPVGEREGTMPGQVVTREETAALTKYLRDALAKSTRPIRWSGRALSSREHSALSRSRAQLEAARRLVDFFDRKLVGVTEDFPANGAVLPGDDEVARRHIFINVGTDRPEILVVSHEMLHLLEKSDPDLYQELSDMVDPEAIRQYLNETRPEHVWNNLSDATIKEEFLADYLSEMMGKRSFWEDLASRDASLFERFADYVIAFLREIRDRIAGDKIKVERYLRDQAAMRDKLLEVMVAFKARQAQFNAGILDGPMEESMPFADRRTLPIKGPAFVGMERNGEAFKMPFTVPLRDGSRISGYTDSKLTTFYGYDKNGDQFTWSVSRFRIDDVDTSKRKGEAKVELERFIDSVRSAQESDIRFADPRRVEERSEFGQYVLSPAAVQGHTEAREVIRAEYFDSRFEVTDFGVATAMALLEDIEFGRIDLREETGFTQANQVLKGELWTYALKMVQKGDFSMFYRMDGGMNDYFERESSEYGRGLSALAWYTRQLDKTLSEVERGKKAKVNESASVENGQVQDLAEEVARLQKEIDALRLQVSDFSQSEMAEIAGAVAGKRTTGNTDRAAKILTGGKKGGKRIASLASELDDFLRGGASDILFSDPNISPDDKAFLIRRILEEQVSSGKRKRAVFIRNLTKLGMTEELAANRFERAMGFRERAKQALKEDQAESKASEEPKSAQSAFLDALDEESKRIDRLNQKVDGIVSRLTAGPKKRESDPSKKSDIDKFVAAEISKGSAFDREAAIKGSIRMGISQGSAAKLADAIQAEINDRASRQRQPKTVSERAAAIAERFNNPQDLPPRAKDPLRVLVNTTLLKNSTISESEFMSRAAKIGVKKAEVADLWNALANERQKREDIRGLKQQADAESRPDKEAQAIISKLAASQFDTQDNRTQEVRENAIRAIYQDYVAHGAYGERPGPAMSQPGFVQALLEEGVSPSEANLLATLATREKQNRLETAKGKASVNAVERSVPFIMREILAQPSLRLVGPEGRIRMMAKVFEDRAGLLPVDARVAAAKFEAQLVKKWDEAAKRLADEYASKRNAPGFRREGAVSVDAIFNGLEAKGGVDVAAMRRQFEAYAKSQESPVAMRAKYESLGASKGEAAALTKMSMPERGQKTPFDKIREAIRAGAYDPRKRLLDEVAKSNGWTDLTELELQRLAELDASLDAENLTDFEKGRIQKEMARIINQSNLPEPVKKVIREYMLANMFSGPRTWGVQTSVFFAQAYNVLVRDFAGALAGSAMGSNTLNMTGWTSAMRNSLRHIKNGIADGSLTLKTGQVRGTAEEEILNAVSQLEVVYDRNLAIFENPRSTRAQKSAAVIKIILSSVRYYLRILGGLDGLFQGVIRTYIQETELFSQAAGLGMDQKAVRQMVGEVMNLVPDFEKIAESKGFGNVTIKGRELPIPSPEKMAYVNDRIAMSIHRALEGRGLSKDVIEASKERSFRESAMETGVNQFEQGTSFLPRAIAEKSMELVREGPAWMTMLLPVIRTAFNMLHRSAWHGAYGLVRLAHVGIKTKGFRVWRDAKGKALSPYENSLADPVQLARRSAEAIVGTILWTGLIALIAAESEKEDEDKLIRINLAGPPSSNRAAFTAWRREGRRPFTLQFRLSKKSDWSTHGFRGGGWEVFNFPLTLIGAWDQKEYGYFAGVKDPWNRYAGTLAVELGGELFFPLRSFSSRRMMSADSLSGQLGYWASSLVPGAAMLRTPNRFRDYQDYEGPGAAFAAQIPVVQLFGENTPRLNGFGDPIGSAERNMSFIGASFGIPVGSVPAAKYWTPGQTPTDDHVYQLSAQKGWFPGMPSESSLGEDVALDTYREFTQVRGKAIKDFMKANFEALRNLDEERFKAKMREVSASATDRAKRAIKVKVGP